MISDVPVGAFLSGGVDSSSVVALMRDNTDKEIKTFNVSYFGQSAYDEKVESEKISKLFNTNHYNITLKPNDIIETTSSIIEIYDEPQADTTSIPLFLISKLAKEQNIKVVLNGDGPDEIFSGYNYNVKYLRYHPYFKILSSLPKKILSTLFYSFKDSIANKYLLEIVSRIINDQEYYWTGATSFKGSEKNNLLSKSFKDEIGNHSSYDYINQLKQQYFNFNDDMNDTSDIVEWMSFSTYSHTSIQNYLFRSDRLGMANSIEARSPYLCNEIVELALSIPSNYKIRNGVPKYIFKKSLERILPKEVLYRKKIRL